MTPGSAGGRSAIRTAAAGDDRTVAEAIERGRAMSAREAAEFALARVPAVPRTDASPVATGPAGRGPDAPRPDPPVR